MYVRLSDPPPDLNVPEYIWIPQMRMWVKEDYFDSLNPQEWRVLMAQLASYQPEVANRQLSEAMYLADKATRKARRDARKEKKSNKTKDKEEKRDAKNEIRKARADAKKEGRGANVLGSVVDGLKSFVGGQMAPTDTSYDAGGGGSGGGGDDDDDDDLTPWYKKPSYIIGGVIGVAVVVGGGIALSRMNRN